ncbi:MAG: tRNA 2-thiouridine(34) synthase MnmA [Coriobacteriia bacterium]|nr:tRNA 2-thiouridine(34) synthase MnmA [Coriobacteriia bacterium]
MRRVRPAGSARCAWVALSGGVDSAVAAALALDSGLDVVGVTMRLGVSEHLDEAVVGASAEVAGVLGIPHHVIDLSAPFEESVVRPFIDSYVRGETPNPCVLCNDHLKFGVLSGAAVRAGADVLITGHYARIDDHDGLLVLLRGMDTSKDQSYFLYRLVGARLDRLCFPLGGMRKSEVRKIALERGLPSADSTESQDVCFLTGSDAASFLAAKGVAPRVGEIVDMSGEVLGTHDGVWRFTVGQRKGIGVGGGPPLYVVAIDADRARVIVGPADACNVRNVTARDVVWDGPDGELRIQAQVRYRATPQPGNAVLCDGVLSVCFDSPVSGVAHGQSLVCYEGDRVIGGGYLMEAS